MAINLGMPQNESCKSIAAPAVKFSYGVLQQFVKLSTGICIHLHIVTRNFTYTYFNLII